MDDQFMPYIRQGHALFNIMIYFFFIYQAYLGAKIRAAKRRGGIDILAIKRHRRNGPIWASLGLAGYIAGLTIVTVDQGHPYIFPLHFIIGTSIAVLISTTFIISRIMRTNQLLRNIHLGIGTGIISLYTFQIIVGIGVLSTFR